MTLESNQGAKKTEMQRFDSLLSVLPAGSEIQTINFGVEHSTDQVVLMELPHQIRHLAVLDKGESGSQEGTPSPDLLILTIPTLNQDEVGLLAKVQEWVDTAAQDNHPNNVMMTLQGAQVLWRPGRLAILAQSDRLAAIRMALIETLFYESELRDIERLLGDTWPQLVTDMPLAFEFDERSVSKRSQLLARFRQVLLIRVRLARIAPHVHCPHLHPPTLASQVGERLRERTRMAYRREVLIEQVDVFEKIYEACGQRASDFMLNRSNNTLEWVIIVLLLSQILLAGFEILTSIG